MSDTKSSAETSRRAVVEGGQAGWRLDRFLAAALPDFSRSRLQQLLESGAVTHARETIKDANHRVKPGEAYLVTCSASAPAIPQGQDIPLEVVYEDKDLIVIDKPAGLVVHPAAGNPDGTLVNALIAHCGASLSASAARRGPASCTGSTRTRAACWWPPRTERAMASLAKQFANHTIERAYHAVVWGAPRAGEGTDRRPDRPQSIRPQAHGGAARRRQGGAHALSRDREIRRSASGPSPP